MSNFGRHRRIGLAAAVSVGAVLMLGGCTPASVASKSFLGFPPGAGGDVLDIPRAFGDGSTLYLSLGGSSSCPTVPTSIAESDDELVITISNGWAILCTADISVTTYEFSVDPMPGQIVVAYGEERQTLEVEPL